MCFPESAESPFQLEVAASTATEMTRRSPSLSRAQQITGHPCDSFGGSGRAKPRSDFGEPAQHLAPLRALFVEQVLQHRSNSRGNDLVLDEFGRDLPAADDVPQTDALHFHQPLREREGDPACSVGNYERAVCDRRLERRRTALAQASVRRAQHAERCRMNQLKGTPLAV